MADYTLSIAGAANGADANKTGVTTSDRVIVSIPQLYKRARIKVFAGTSGHRVWIRRGAAPATGLYDQLLVGDSMVVTAPSGEQVGPWTIYAVPQDGTVSISASGLLDGAGPADSQSAASSAGLATLISEAAFTANYLKLGVGYATVAAETGGVVLNRLPTSTTTSIAAGGFVAGVAATSNPTVEVSSTTGFSAGDIVEVYGSVSNNGFYEVDAVLAAPARLRLKGVGTTTTVEAWTKTQVNAEAGTGTVHKVGVAVLRVDSNGLLGYAVGNTVPLTYKPLYLVNTTAKVADYTAVVGDFVLVDMNGASGDVTITMPTSPAPADGAEWGLATITTHATRNLIVSDGGGADVQNLADSGFASSVTWSTTTLLSMIWRYSSAAAAWIRR